MPTSVYKSLNFGDLEPIGMTIQLANRSVVQPLGVLEDVLSIFVLDMEDETLGKGSTLILGRPFLMIARTKIDVHVRTLSMEFGDTLVQFNIFEAMKHPTEDHSLFGIDLIDELQHSIIVAKNLHREREDKLLHILRQHKKAIRWKLSDLLGINSFICMHRILMEEEARPIRLNPTILAVVKKEVTKLLAIGIIYPISDNQWVSLVQVVPKKSRMIVMKNQHNELATRKDHFPLPFIDQVLEKLAGKSHYCFLDGFSGYMQIHIAPEDQHKTTFTCPFGTFSYTRMSFGLGNAPSTFQRCMTSIFSDLLHDCMEVFMDDFTVYVGSFDACLGNLSKVLMRCIDTNLVLNIKKCHFKVDKSKIDIITSLPNPTSVQDVRSFLRHAGFYRRFIKNFSKIVLPLSKLLQKDVEFKFDQPCVEAFQELKNRLTSIPIL
ncbi:Retrovirus-related Pol polyprotein from transposon 17.6, partial [Mucuna pruriens]